MGHRDAGQRGDGDRAGDARHHLHRDARRHARVQLLHAAAEHERVAALEPHHPLAGQRALDQELVDLLLGHRPAARQLGGVDDLDVGGQRGQQRQRRQVVGDDDVGLRERLAAPHGDQPWIAGAAADQHHAAGNTARHATPRPVGDAAVGEPADDGVADTHRPLRIAAAVHADHQLAMPADGGGPRAGGGPVVGAGAEDAVPLGLLGHRGVHRRIVGGGHDVPGAHEIARRVAEADPAQAPGLDERLQCGSDLGADDGDPRTGLQQPGHAPVGHLSAAHHHHAPAGEPQTHGVDHPGLRADRARAHGHRIPAVCYGGVVGLAARPPRLPARRNRGSGT